MNQLGDVLFAEEHVTLLHGLIGVHSVDLIFILIVCWFNVKREGHNEESRRMFHRLHSLSNSILVVMLMELVHLTNNHMLPKEENLSIFQSNICFKD